MGIGIIGEKLRLGTWDLGLEENWGLQGPVAYPLSGRNGWLAWYRNLVSGWENAESQKGVDVDVDVDCRT